MENVHCAHSMHTKLHKYFGYGSKLNSYFSDVYSKRWIGLFKVWRSFIKSAHFCTTKSDSWESPGIFTRCVLFWCSSWRKTIQAHQSFRHVTRSSILQEEFWHKSTSDRSELIQVEKTWFNRFTCLGQQKHNNIISWCRQEYVHYYLYIMSITSL